MAITRFEDLPSTNSPIISENLNGNFDELGVKVGTSVDNNYRTNIIKGLNGNASIVVDGEEIYSKGQNEEYSTAEQVIGTWIDGKPRYRKTIDYTIASGERTWHAIERMSNIKSLVIKEVFVIRAAEIYLNLYNNYNFYYNYTTEYLYEQHDMAYYEGYHMYITIEYTKTTD